MKFFFLIISVLLFCSCKAQHRLTHKDIMDMNNETFDFDFYEKNKQANGQFLYQEIQKDGTFIDIAGGGKVNVFVNISKPPHYFVQTKEFNKNNGKLIKKGILLNGCRIEKWLECDEIGDNCKVVDYEKNRGKFSYEDVLKFLEKRKFIDRKVRNEEDQGTFDLNYSYEQRVWKINASRKNALGYFSYELDGDSGKILKENYTSTMY